MKKLPDHSRVFVEEIASDALQILPQFTLGFAKPLELLTRGVIENAVRHFYFTDHRIEFIKMNTQPKWYMQVDALFTYALEYPELAKLEKAFDVLRRMDELYGELSATVHGRRVQDLQMKTALTKIAFQDASARLQESLLKRVTECVNATLAVFHLDEFRSFPTEDRRLILSTISAKGRRAISAL